MNRKTIIIMVSLVGVLSLAAVGFTAAQDSFGDNSVEITDPENQTVTVGVSFSDPGEATASLETDDGSTVEQFTVSGSAGESKNIPLMLTGVAEGTYTLNYSLNNATVDNTTLTTFRDAMLNVSSGETVAVDVGFESANTANATVTLEDGGTQLNQTTVMFDPIDADDGTSIETAEFTPAQDVAAGNITVETTPAESQTQIWLSEGAATAPFGGFISDMDLSRNQILIGLAALIGLVVIGGRDR